MKDEAAVALTLYASRHEVRRLAAAMQIKTMVDCSSHLLSKASIKAADYAHAHRDFSGDAVGQIANSLTAGAASLAAAVETMHEITEELAKGLQSAPYYTKQTPAPSAEDLHGRRQGWNVYGIGEVWLGSFRSEEEAEEFAKGLNARALGE
jgi:hypothetical protein